MYSVSLSNKFTYIIDNRNNNNSNSNSSGSAYALLDYDNM